MRALLLMIVQTIREAISIAASNQHAADPHADAMMRQRF